MRFARKLALLFALAALPAAAAPAQSADEHFRNSRARAQSGDFAGAVVELDKAIARRKDFAEAYQARAGFKILTNDLDGALADITRALELTPDLKSAYQIRASIKFHKNDLDGALEDYNRSIAEGWMMYESYLSRGNVRRAKGDLEGAIEDFGAAIALAPRRPEAYLNRSFVLREKGDEAGAMADLNAAAEAGAPDPSSIVPRSGAGEAVAQKRAGEPGKPSRVVATTRTEAIALPDAAVVADGPSAEMRSEMGARMGAAMALSNRGVEMMRQGKPDAAIEDYTKSIEIFPTSIAYLNRASARREKGDLDGALADLNRAIELNPRDPTSYYTRGQIMLDLGREQEARKDFARCLELDPKMKPLVDSSLPGGGRKGESKRP